MKYIEEYRNPLIIKNLVGEIHKAAKKVPYTVNFMEVCGTHTMAIGRFGIRQLLPTNIKLLSGPGCPVCVTPDEYIDKAIALSQMKDVIITTFGDMVKVPGSYSSLEKEQAKGKNIQIVYSPLEAFDIAEIHPSRKVIFLGIGFETTAPAVALTIKKAYAIGLKNFTVLSGHKLIPPAMETLIEDDKDVKIDGFICPGHVSAIIGSRPYENIATKYRVPCVIAGFEPSDILEAVLLLTKRILENKTGVENQYKRVVKREGNIRARKIMEEVFDIVDSEWRGIGTIKKSGLAIKERYREFNADKRHPLKIKVNKKRHRCICGDILKGKKIPVDCKLFGKVCRPESPVGPCMVSSEGSCAAYYRYEKW